VKSRYSPTCEVDDKGSASAPPVRKLLIPGKTLCSKDSSERLQNLEEWLRAEGWHKRAPPRPPTEGLEEGGERCNPNKLHDARFRNVLSNEKTRIIAIRRKKRPLPRLPPWTEEDFKG
jgi:hypothetical protein